MSKLAKIPHFALDKTACASTRSQLTLTMPKRKKIEKEEEEVESEVDTDQEEAEESDEEDKAEESEEEDKPESEEEDDEEEDKQAKQKAKKGAALIKGYQAEILDYFKRPAVAKVRESLLTPLIVTARQSSYPVCANGYIVHYGTS